MCGLAGIAGGSANAADRAALAERMAERLQHRGPDDAGHWSDAAAPCALAHRRLAILDRSTSAAQPMQSACGRYVLAYNGEVYNFAALRTELETQGHPFRGSGDTEVVLAACAHWGPLEAARRFRGMFALALWDRHERQLWLLRDPLGIKPLYYSHAHGRLLFASELKALQADPGFRTGIDPRALSAYSSHRYIPSPLSIYAEARKLGPGEYLRWRPGDGPPQPEVYWTPPAEGSGETCTGEPAADIEALLRASVREQLRADVPTGVLLSGGIDSSLIAALAQQEADAPIATFTLGFDHPRYDEAPAARRIAEHLGTRHTELQARVEDLRTLIPELPEHYDEPFADSSQLPSLLLARLMRREVTVALSGDGGDELFGGYDHYFKALAAQHRAQRLPAGAWRALGTLSGWLGRLPPLPAPARRRLRRWQRLAPLLAGADEQRLYRHFAHKGCGPQALRETYRQPPWPLADGPAAGGFLARMTHWDTRCALPDRMLAKVDRASMATGLEIRVPLLDQRLVERVLGLPEAQRFGNPSKPLLRALAARYLPAEVLQRPKSGFSIPLRHWLRGPLHEWAADLLSPQRLQRTGYFDAGVVGRLWREHQSGLADHHHGLWTVLMFEAWAEHYAAGHAAARL